MNVPKCIFILLECILNIPPLYELDGRDDLYFMNVSLNNVLFFRCYSRTLHPEFFLCFGTKDVKTHPLSMCALSNESSNCVLYCE